MNRWRVLGLFCVMIVLFGCGAVQTVQTIGAVAMNARALTQGYYGMKMAKAMKNAEPIFQNYDSLRVEVLLNPREGDAKTLTDAFKDNLQWLIPKDVQVAGLELEVCGSVTSCKGRTIVVQFKEEGYGTGIIKSFLIGEKLKGKLYFIDAQTSTIIAEKPLEVASNYADLIREIHIYVGTAALKTLEMQKDAEKVRKAVDEFNKIDPIKDEYKELFAKAK
ncbi:MAG: hypothetical protein D6778_08410 [Nitrospirae bacterium]|nr:MAG: hypothetical protein D6778_08410 [Nitrospirota bacterium]